VLYVPRDGVGYVQAGGVEAQQRVEVGQVLLDGRLLPIDGLGQGAAGQGRGDDTKGPVRDERAGVVVGHQVEGTTSCKRSRASL